MSFDPLPLFSRKWYTEDRMDYLVVSRNSTYNSYFFST